MSDHGTTLLRLARAAIREHLGIAGDNAGSDSTAQSTQAIMAANPWLDQPGASFVTLTENGRLRGCIGTLEAYRSLGRDVAAHAVDAAVRDPRFRPVSAAEYPLLDIEVSVLGNPEPITIAADDGDHFIPVRSRDELERTLHPGVDGLIIADQYGHRATFLPQVWQQLPEPHEFVSHLLAKAGLNPATNWQHGEVACQRYEVRAYAEA